MSDRMLPHDMAAEKAVLGAALISEAAWPRAAAILRGDEFFRQAHRQLFEAMGRLVAKGVAVDPLTLGAELKTQNLLDDCGGPAYIASLTDGVPRASNVDHYAALVREQARLRLLLQAGAVLQAGAYDAERPAAELAAEASRAVSDAMGSTGVGGTVLASDAIETYVGHLAGGTLPQPLQTGYSDLDTLCGGLVRPGLSIVAARPSVGKTAFVMGAAERIARAGLPVVVFSLEMAIGQLAARQVSWRVGASVDRLERGLASDEQYQKAATAGHDLVGKPLYLNDSARTVSEIMGWCHRLRHERGGLACAVIDYLQLLLPEHRMDSKSSEVAAISRAMKRMAIELGIAVVALSQLSRGPEQRKDKRPQLQDLRDSGALEQDADMAVLLYRPEMHKATPENTGIAEVIVAKNRQGPTGVLKLAFRQTLARFEDLSRDELPWGGAGTRAETPS